MTMKRIVSIFLAILCILSCFSQTVLAADSEYWARLNAYNNAVAGGKTEEILSSGEKLLAYFPNFDSNEACNTCRYPALKMITLYKEQGKRADADRCAKIYVSILEYQKAYDTIYWFYKGDYDSAVTGGNSAEITAAAEAFVNYYAKSDDVERLSSCIEPMVRLISLYEKAGKTADAARIRNCYDRASALIQKNGTQEQQDRLYWPKQAAYNEALASGKTEDIISACEDILSLYGAFDSVTACSRSLVQLLKLISLYEEGGRYADALNTVERYKKALTYLEKHTAEDHTEELLFADAYAKQYAFLTPQVYAADTASDAIPYYGAKNEPEAGTYVGMCGTYRGGRDNAYLLYVRFFDETIPSFAWKLPKTDEPYYLEVAWNVPNESRGDFDKINSGAYDDYIIDNLKYLDTLPDNCRILLRFGAEINNWACISEYRQNGTLPAFIDSFKKAFRRIAGFAREYAPGAAMVYSPDNVSNLYVTVEDFYPGDEWVDWVGMSTYMRRSANTVGVYGSATDAYYCRGVYENQIIRIKPIIDAFGAKKPIMISECGFPYRSEAGDQTEAYAKEKLEYFYSYVNMVYPQVKAIFYFNTTTPAGEKDRRHYQLFDEDGNAAESKTVSAAYTGILKTNEAIFGTLTGVPKSYVPVTSYSDISDTLTLSLFAAYPGSPEITVTYALDGKTVGTTKTVPYTVVIPSKALTQGRHTLHITSARGGNTDSLDYVVYVSTGGRITVKEPDMKDIPAGNWAEKYVSYAIGEGWFDGLCGEEFGPNAVVTRGMFAALLGRCVGVDPDHYTQNEFDDVAPDAYYAPYIAWAKEVGVTNGTGEGRFSPDQKLTRDQVCAMIVRYCDNAGIALVSGEGSERFADDAKIPSYSRDAVYCARAAGLVNGKGGNIYDPAGDLTRAEISVILMNFHQKYVLNRK